MEREFIIFKSFERAWTECNLDDDDLRRLQNLLCRRPDAGPVIPDTGGIRKLRWAIPTKGKGKRGGVRVIYIDYALDEQIYLLTAYPKGVQEDLTDDQKRILKAKAADIEAAMKRRRKKAND